MALNAAAAALAVDKSEFWHFSLDLQPKLAMDTTQWPYYDDLVYQSIVWDREYSIVAGFTLDFTIELAHMAYYKLTYDFKFLQLGFGINDILFEERPSHYCSLYYLDSRLMETSLAFETNTKPCTFANSSLIERLSWHWDSRDKEQASVSEDQKQNDDASASSAQSSTNDQEDQPKLKGWGHLIARIYDSCELDKDYDPKYFLRHELYHRDSLLPDEVVDHLYYKEVFASTCWN